MGWFSRKPKPIPYRDLKCPSCNHRIHSHSISLGHSEYCSYIEETKVEYIDDKGFKRIRQEYTPKCECVFAQQEILLNLFGAAGEQIYLDQFRFHRIY